MFLNIFIAVILQGFSDSEALEQGMLTGTHYDDFREHWVNYDPEGTGLIESSDLPSLLAELEPPLGYKDKLRRKSKILKYLADCELNLVDVSKYHFYEVANALLTRVYMKQHEGDEFENDAPVFKELDKKANKVFPGVLRMSSEYNSKHVAATLFI
jgi:hypothetical protein